MAATGEQTRARALDPGDVETVAAAIDAGRIEEVEIFWPDHYGHACGKRIDATDFISRATGAGFAFCPAALTWDVAGVVQEGPATDRLGDGLPGHVRGARPRDLPCRCRGGRALRTSCRTSSTTTAS